MPFAAGTLIRMSGGGTKAIESVTTADTVRGYDAAGSAVNLAVRATTVYAARPVITFRSLTCTPDTVFLSPKGHKTIKEIGPNGFVYDTSEDPFRVGTVTTPADAAVYNIEVAGNNTFIAGGWRVKG